jgi:tetratricopeptide (TPR) repeat protein
MRVAVYTIAKNEAQFVDRWAESCRDADYRLILDTGSTDGTQELADDLDITVIDAVVRPWRFDDARNAALALLPEDIDYCISLDMDEVLQPGWRNHLEKMHDEQVTRPRYKYTWSWKPNGEPDLQYGGDKIHTRFGYRWKHVVHETLVPTVQEKQGWCDLEIHHHPDHTKSRAQYGDLLAIAVAESPDDDRVAFYWARELFYMGRHDEAVAEFQRYLRLPSAVWRPERAAAYRFMAKCEPARKEHWLKFAVLEAPDRREGWHDLALLYYDTGAWMSCLMAAQNCLSIKEMPLEYLCEAEAWGSSPYDLAALAAHSLGYHREAAQYGTKALELAPDNERLKGNLVFYTDALANM